ncbi:hypothetical protein GIB67_019385 [Kingdonia uniflora]|uniref:Uncharacterized protein n=1 Tax=Kingdonia uniflora TaxID=39325 RepID=A0A7J7M1P6_9MAGN|nr:hypothetical protein GIB67_019385 [Kingdonia uniflora]
MKHLRKCIQCLVETSSNEDVSINSKTDIHSVLEDYLAELSNKVGDVGPILDMMAMVFENIPTTAILAMVTILSVYRTTQLISTVPNISYYKKAFPEVQFYQLILAMAHPDPETRVGAHRILSVVLMPSLDCSWSDPSRKASVALSEFYSSATASQKSRRSIFVYSGGECQTDVMDEEMNEERNRNMDMGVLNNIVCPSHSFKLSSPYVVVDGKEEVILLG